MQSLPTISFDCPRTCPLYEQADHGIFWCRFRPILDAIGPVKVNSHISQVKLDARDLDRLEAAVIACGLVFNRGQRTYRWYGRLVGDYHLQEGITEKMLGKCDHAISVPGNRQAYEIGVVARPDGGYTLLWDFFAGGYGLEKLAGKDCVNLATAYAQGTAWTKAQELGWLTEKNGEGVVTIYHPSGGTLTISAGGEVETQGFVGGKCHEAREALGIAVDGIVQKSEGCGVAARIELPSS